MDEREYDELIEEIAESVSVMDDGRCLGADCCGLYPFDIAEKIREMKLRHFDKDCD